MLECVVNISEGRDVVLIERLTEAAEAGAAGPVVLDIHTDPYHHRSVFTLAGEDDGRVEEAVRALARATVELVDIRAHAGAHPRIGALDVVPFVALDPDPSDRLADGPIGRAKEARDGFAAWAADELALPCFTYGPERTLPEVRRGAWTTLPPDFGPPHPHPSAGAAAVGARPALVAYNLWLGRPADLQLARTVAAAIRNPYVRALGLQVGTEVQVSCNLIAPWISGPGAAFDAVTAALPGRSGIERAELVGLLPQAVLEAEPSGRWAELDLDPSKSIEARLEQAGLDGGSFR